MVEAAGSGSERTVPDAGAGPPRPHGLPLAAGRRERLIRAYVALTKPRIIELLLVTTVPAMVLAWRYVDGMDALTFAWLVVATLIGGTLAAGAANAINNVYDRDIDQIMIRTRRRPLPGPRGRRPRTRSSSASS